MMDLSRPATWAALYAAAGLGYLLSRLVAVFQSRSALFGSAEAHMSRSILISVTAFILLLASLLWPGHFIAAVTTRLRRRQN